MEYDGLSNSQPLRVDANNHTVTMLVQINGRFLTDDTRHGIVFKDGSNGHKSLFMGYATPKAFYEALKEAGGTPGENMTMDNKETTHVTGSKLDISVNWQGAAKAYSFDEVIVDSNGKKLDMRFGGNLTAAEEENGLPGVSGSLPGRHRQQCNIHLWCGGKTRRSEIQRQCLSSPGG